METGCKLWSSRSISHSNSVWSAKECYWISTHIKAMHSSFAAIMRRRSHEDGWLAARDNAELERWVNISFIHLTLLPHGCLQIYSPTASVLLLEQVQVETEPKLRCGSQLGCAVNKPIVLIRSFGGSHGDALETAMANKNSFQVRLMASLSLPVSSG